MCHLAGQTLGQIDNLDGLKRAFFDAHAAAYAEVFRKEANRRGGRHINAQFALHV